MYKKIYVIEIHFNDDYEIDYNFIEELIENSNRVLDKEYLFYEKVNLEQYDVFKVNSYLRYKLYDIDNSIIEKIEKLKYVKSIKYNILKEKQEISKKVEIEVSKIDDIIDDIDKVFFLRKKLFSFSKLLPNSKKKDYLDNLKELSMLKYSLKRSVFDLRIVDINKELDIIYNIIKDYINILGINIEFIIKHDEIKIDKLLFYRIKEAIIDILHNSVMGFFEEKNKNIDINTEYKIQLELKQSFGKLYIEIVDYGRSLDIKEIYNNALSVKILNYNQLYSEKEILMSIFKKSYINSVEDIEVKERIMNQIKYSNIVSELGGRVELIHEKDKYIKNIATIPLDIVFLNGLVFNEMNKSYILDKATIQKQFNFNKDNLLTLNGFTYYKLDDKNIMYIKLPINKDEKSERIGFLLKILDKYIVVDTSTNIYEEDVYFNIDKSSKIYIGECLLKTVKKARVLNMEEIIKLMKG